MRNRTVGINIRVTVTEKKKVTMLARKCGLSLSEYLRQRALGYEPGGHPPNLHNHFVINSVSYVDGKKYEQRRSQYAEFRAASDKLCREYGLSVVEQPKAKEPARYARMREAIDQACEDASTAEDFHRALYRQGYIFGSDPNRRYATIRARDGGRAVRLYRLGEEYDLAAIDDRLRGNYLLYGPTYKQ